VIPPFAAWRNAARYVALPPSATDRSLAIPLADDATPPEWFKVPDGKGRCVLVGGEDVDDELDVISEKIGQIRTSGTASRAACVTLGLGYSPFTERTMESAGFYVATLSQFVDGEDWLESAVFMVGDFVRRFGTPIARVRIGPTERVGNYAAVHSLRRAVSIFAELLDPAGCIVVLYGRKPMDTVQGSIVTDIWTVVKADPQGGRPLTLLASSVGVPSVKLIPKLD
jgi:hypothetical protein